MRQYADRRDRNINHKVTYIHYIYNTIRNGVLMRNSSLDDPLQMHQVICLDEPQTYSKGINLRYMPAVYQSRWPNVTVIYIYIYAYIMYI